jgi:lysophospholipase L1-like esterase
MSNQTLFNKARAIQETSDQETPMRTIRFSSVLAMLAIGMLAAPANASVLLQEDFNYTPGVYTSVAGGGGWGNSFPGITQGTVGFADNWSWNAAGSKLGIGAADATHNDGAYYDGSQTGGAVALFDISLPTLTPVYQSMLFGQTGANNGNFILRSAGGWGFATVGVNGAGKYALTVGGSTVDTTIPVSATGFDQILMDFTRADQEVFGNVTVNLWVNPNWASLGAPSASVTASTAYPNIQELLMQGGGVTVDRIRVGTTLADVQINPEPAPPADAGNSTVAASPGPVPANGVSTATITVTLLDGSSAAVAGKTVTLASNRAAGIDTISAASGSSNTSGVVTFTVTSLTAGAPVFTATDVTDSVVITATASVTFTANSAASAGTSTVTASPGTVTANGASTATITVTLRDGSSAPVTGKTVTLASSRGATDTISAASGSSNASGVVTFTVTSLTAGAPVFTATDVTDSNLLITATATVTFTAVPGGSLLLQEDFNYPPGVSTSVAGGGGWGNSFPNITQGAAGFIGNWDWNAAGAKFGVSAADATHNDGAYYDGSMSTNGQRAPISIALPSNTPVYQSMLFGKTGTNNGHFVFWDHGGYNMVTLGINSSGHYALTVGQGATVDTTIPVNATGFDQILMAITRADQAVWGNATVSLWVNPNWSSLGAPAVTDTASTAYPDISQWLLDGGGMAVDRVRIGTSLAEVQINPADAGTSTVAATPSPVPADGITTSTITVTLRDAGSVAVAGKTVTLASNRAPGIDTIAAASGVSNGSGVVTFTVTSATPGTPVFTATDVTDSIVITATASVTFSAVPPANAATSTVTASPTSQRADGVNTSTLTVTLRDGSSAPIPGKSVTLASSRGATDTISAASGTSNVSGVVTFTVKSTTVGTPVFTATDVTDTVTVSQTATVSFTANPAASAGNSTVEASPSSVVANGTSPATITVTLKASNGTAVAGKSVTLASNRGATDTISAASGTSDAAGVVTFTVTSLTDGGSIFTATATTDGVIVSQTAAVTFTAATNVIDISNAIGPAVEGRISIDDVVPVGHSGRLVGITDAYWATGGVARDLDLNGNTLTFESGGGNTMNISGAISGNGMVRVNAGGISIFHLSGSVGNTYTGTTEINNGPVKLEKSSGNALCGTITVNGGMSNSFPGTGTLLWGANNQIHDASNLTLTVGSSMNFNGYSDTLGTLALTGDASIYLTGSTSVARFANSSAQAWPSGKELIIREWNGAPSGGGSESVFFGTSAGGLSAAQLASVGFMNPAGFAAGLYHAAILATGEVVPTGSAVVPVNPPYDLSPTAAAARTAIYTSTGRADLTAVGTPLATGTRIVFFGDSITHGGGYITPLNTAIASGAGTQGKTITLINRGINGGTAANIRDGSPIWGYPGNSPQASFDSLLVSDQADIAVVYIGINDLWWAGTTAAAYEQALRDLAASAAARGVTLIFATPAAHGESPIGAGGDDPKIDQFSAIVQTVAADTGSTFVDLRSVFVAWWQNNNYEIRLDGSFVTLKPYGLLTYDGIHPSFLGLDMVADQMAEGILAALTAGSAFDIWAGTGTGGKGLTGAAAAFDADPDYDGIPNGIEFVIGGEPNPATAGSNSRALLPTAAASGNNLVFTYTRTHAAAYLNPVVEFDADMLGAWTTATSGNATIAAVTGTMSDTVTVTIPKGSNKNLFARLKVVNTP